jgi:hypothetical protein
MLNLKIQTEDIGYLRLLLDLASIEQKKIKNEKRYNNRVSK